MGRRTIFKRLGARLGRALYLLGRPARADRGHGGTAIQAYRGFASRHEIFLMGRAFRQPRVSPKLRQGRLGRHLVDLGRRIVRHGAPGVAVQADFGGAQQRLTTDRFGYFCVNLRLTEPLASTHLWHRLSLETTGEAGPCRVAGAFFLPPPEARYVVISDLDDTVIFTGVANKMKMLWRLFLQGAKERVAFPGVAAFYRALHRGVGGGEFNPMLYVSRSPWGLYEVLEEFFHLHGIPAGPILFLREWGITGRRPFPRRAKEHKLSLIRRMLTVYDSLPFILIGDSGQRDPEIYAQIVREHPGRVQSIYIRHVSGAARQRAIENLAREVVAADSTLLLAVDTQAMVRHAVEHGFILPEAKEPAAGQAPERHPTRKLSWPVRPSLRRTLARRQPAGKTKEAANVVIEGLDRASEKG